MYSIQFQIPADTSSAHKNMGLTTSPLRKSFGEEFQREKTRGTRDYGSTEQSCH